MYRIADTAGLAVKNRCWFGMVDAQVQKAKIWFTSLSLNTCMYKLYGAGQKEF